MLYMTAAVCVCCAAVFFLIYKISPGLLAFVLNFLSNAVISFAAMTLYNIAGGAFGLHMGINIFSVLICAAGGVPAFAAIAAVAAILPR